MYIYPISTDGFASWLNYHFYLSAGMHNNLTNRNGFLSSALEIVQTQSSSFYNCRLSLSTWARLQHLDCSIVWLWHCRCGGHPSNSHGNVDSRAWPYHFHHLWGFTLPMHCLGVVSLKYTFFEGWASIQQPRTPPEWIYKTVPIQIPKTLKGQTIIYVHSIETLQI